MPAAKPAGDAQADETPCSYGCQQGVCTRACPCPSHRWPAPTQADDPDDGMNDGHLHGDGMDVRAQADETLAELRTRLFNGERRERGSGAYVVPSDHVQEIWREVITHVRTIRAEAASELARHRFLTEPVVRPRAEREDGEGSVEWGVKITGYNGVKSEFIWPCRDEADAKQMLIRANNKTAPEGMDPVAVIVTRNVTEWDEDYGLGCDCTELCEMGPTCPGAILGGVEGSGCWRTTIRAEREEGEGVQWECGPHANAWNGHDARCRRVPAPASDREACGNCLHTQQTRPLSCHCACHGARQ